MDNKSSDTQIACMNKSPYNTKGHGMDKTERSTNKPGMDNLPHDTKERNMDKQSAQHQDE